MIQLIGEHVLAPRFPRTATIYWRTLGIHHPSIISLYSIASANVLELSLFTYTIYLTPDTFADRKMVCTKCQKKISKTTLATPAVKRKADLYYGSPASGANAHASSSKTKVTGKSASATLGNTGVVKACLIFLPLFFVLPYPSDIRTTLEWVENPRFFNRKPHHQPPSLHVWRTSRKVEQVDSANGWKVKTPH